MKRIIKINKISKILGGETRISISDLSFYKGQKCLVFGKNGAGKTTLLYLLLGLLTPDTGTIIYDTTLKNDKSKINFASSSARLNGYATVEENLRFFSWFYNISDKSRIEFLLDEFGVSHLKSKKYFRLSDGEQARVNLIKALLKKPEILILDEIFAPIDISERKTIQEIIFKNAEYKDTLVVSVEHTVNPSFKDYFNRVIIIKEGSINYDGPLLSESSLLKKI
jgi:ABC-type multidrug transport system ATPase subunit